ncbi:MAG TPA: hypothetical protein PK079_00680 [Leptospiraceae bacterium]|nr:hypothetical protein [Leptospiraceae bacterium]HMW03974.1 hypothetical protein [Leptospiraceae bacterium]HMX33612.1 hypothetical protein [Leptospiraceae bacterium]HMY29954.1 hypothetical protein [Leptospiraceae bacterium]HMZ66769.1 hypothetical protein [Leptospiraceae bacterium]
MSKRKLFTEKEIREKILTKVDPQNINKDGKHWIGEIILNNVFINKVKIPNSHKDTMFHNKTKKIAEDLCITNDEFTDLIDCSLSGKDYYKKLDEKFNPKEKTLSEENP